MGKSSVALVDGFVEDLVSGRVKVHGEIVEELSDLIVKYKGLNGKTAKEQIASKLLKIIIKGRSLGQIWNEVSESDRNQPAASDGGFDTVDSADMI